MERNLIAAATTVLFLIGTVAQAQTDPLWEKALAQAAQVRQWEPGALQLTADSIRGGNSKHAQVRQRLIGWNKGEPVYESVQITPPPAQGSKPKGVFDTKIIRKASDELLKPDSKARRIDNQLLAGKTWTLFEAEQSDGPMDVKLRLWVDPASGVAHRMETTMHGALTMDAGMLTVYKPHPDAGSLPERFELRLKVLLPFAGSTTDIVGEMDGWVRRPVDAQQ